MKRFYGMLSAVREAAHDAEKVLKTMVKFGWDGPCHPEQTEALSKMTRLMDQLHRVSLDNSDEDPEPRNEQRYREREVLLEARRVVTRAVHALVNFGWSDVQADPEQAKTFEGLVELASALQCLPEPVVTTQQHEPSPATPHQTFDLDKIAFDCIKKAADESTWMPDEYTGNDWLSDVCEFLRKGPVMHAQWPVAAPTAPNNSQMEMYRARIRALCMAVTQKDETLSSILAKEILQSQKGTRPGSTTMVYFEREEIGELCRAVLSPKRSSNDAILARAIMARIYS